MKFCGKYKRPVASVPSTVFDIVFIKHSIVKKYGIISYNPLITAVERL